jgi:preprotein translocase subunit SecG
MLLILFTVVHVLVCVFLIIVVLLQSGKAADLAGAFGGIGSQTAFGPRGSATLLSKATTISAVLFMCTSLGLSILATRTSGGVGNTVLDRQAPTKQSVPAGANPAAPAGGAPVIPQPKIEIVNPGQAPATPATVPPKNKKK